LIAEVQGFLTAGGPPARCALHGLPGVGKSALALAVVYHPATLAHFSGGVLWAGLGPHANVDSILGLWAAALGVDVTAEPTADAKAQRLNASLQAILGGRPFLLVLDDAWHGEDVAP